MKIMAIHPPKTGGWSLRDLLNVPEMPQHYSLSYYELQPVWQELDKYLVIATTRNPWDRLVSAFFFLKRVRRIPSAMTFEEYLKSDRDEHQEIKPSNPYWIHCNPVMDWITLNGEIKVDYLLNMHTYQEDYDRIASACHFRPLPHSNATDHDDYKTYYNDELAEIVGTLYKKDIEYFGFTFEDASQSQFDRMLNPEKISRLCHRRQIKLL